MKGKPKWLTNKFLSNQRQTQSNEAANPATQAFQAQMLLPISITNNIQTQNYEIIAKDEHNIQ